MKKTPWFPCSVKPVRPGLYEVELESEITLGARINETLMCQFSGGRWRVWKSKWLEGSPAVGSVRPGYLPLDRWRGIQK